MSARLARKALAVYASPKKAAILQRFFKTGPGQYGEGDIFIGVTVPEVRLIGRQLSGLATPEIINLLNSPIHEERLLALIILTAQYEKGSSARQQEIVSLYLAHASRINNWDLVDLSVYKILGHWLIDKDRTILDKLIRSQNMWERRIAIVATLAFIRIHDLKDTFRLAEQLFSDEEDLLHKAAGWMLREAGKRDRQALENFLKPRYKRMPRTMLRYAIERFPKNLYKAYLQGTI